MENSETFPTSATLWRGVVLGTIAHALWQASDQEFVPDQQWDGINYGLNNEQGARGTVTFAEWAVVAVFCDIHSKRNPWHLPGSPDPRIYFRNAPHAILRLAEAEALQYQLYEFRGVTLPVITAAFWSQGEHLTGTEPWREVVENGAHLLRRQFMEPERALAEWQENYDFSAAQVAVLRSLFERRMASGEERVVVEPWEQRILVQNGDAGIARSRQLLAAVSIVLP